MKPPLQVLLMFVLFFLLLAYVDGHCQPSATGTRISEGDFSVLHQKLLAVITNKNSAIKQVEVAIAHLGTAPETPRFWTTIVNDESYPLVHRQACVMAFFRRHGQYCTGVRELSIKLNNPTWLRDEHIKVADVLGGWIPDNATYSVFEVSLLPTKYVDNAAYISVIGKVERDIFSEVLRGGSAESPPIWDIGLKDIFEIQR